MRKSLPVATALALIMSSVSHSQQSLPQTLDRGGISTTELSFVFYTQDARLLEVRSEPIGIISEDHLVPTNDSWNISNPPVAFKHYQFAYWAENGTPILSPSGLPEQSPTIDMSENRRLVAIYLSSTDDQDKDSLFDWWEWRHFGNLDQNLQSDPDGDGYTLEMERKFKLSYTLPDNIEQGGISTVETTDSAFYLPFAQQPDDLSLRAGSIGSLQAQAEIEGASYQWYRADEDFTDSTPVSGGDTQSLELIIEEGPAWYWMVVSVDGATHSSRKAFVYGIAEDALNGLSIKTKDSTEMYDRIELSVLDSSLEAEKNYAAFVSYDMIDWIRLDTDVIVTGPEAKAIFDVAPIEDRLFFKIEEYEYQTLTELEIAEQAVRLEIAIQSYSERLKEDIRSHPLYSPEDEEVFDLLASLLGELIGEMNETEKAALISSYYNGGVMDEMEAYVNSVDGSPDNIFPLSSNLAPIKPLSIDDDRWDLVRAARSWHVHSDGLKQATANETLQQMLSGSASIVMTSTLNALKTIGDITFNVTPSCPTKLYAFTESQTMNLTPGLEPYPAMEFYADFESKSTLTIELVKLGVNKFVEKLISLYYKSIPLDGGKNPTEDFLIQVSNDAEEWLVKESYSKLSSAVESYFLKYAKKETWNAVQIDPDYFTWPSPIKWEPIYENSKGPGAPAIYDSDTAELVPRWSGNGKIVFSIDDKLCKVILEAEVPFSVINEAPVISEPSPFNLSNLNTSLSSDITIEDDYPDDLNIATSATNGTVEFNLNDGNGTITYQPNRLVLNQPILNANPDEIVYVDLSATFAGGTNDQIELVIDDGINPPETLNIPIDLTPLLDSIEFTLGAPEPGMTSIFAKNGIAQTNGDEILRTQSIGARIATNYGGSGGIVPFSANIGSLFDESTILVFAESAGLRVNAGPDFILTDVDGNGVESVMIAGSATPPEGATIESYTWSWNQESSIGQTFDQSLQIGSTFVRLTVVDSLGSEKYDSVLVSVRSDSIFLSADAGSDATKSDVDTNGSESFLLNASGSNGDIVSWEWSWPGGSASGQSILVDFPIGQRPVTLTVTDSEGNQDTDEILIQVDHGCYPETRPNLNPITLPLRDIYGIGEIGLGADTIFIGDRTGRWNYTQGVDCKPGIVTITYDDLGNDPAVYYEKISLISGYGGTYLFQKFESEQLTHTETGLYDSGDPPQ